MVLYCGADSSLHQNLHHYLVFANFSKVYYTIHHFSVGKKHFLIALQTRRNSLKYVVLNETKVFDDQDSPWINTETEELMTV